MPVPPVSVLLPVYHGRRFLAAAIASIRAQTHVDFECVIVDDGSTDGSAEIIDGAAAADPRIRLVRQPNRGLVPALNAGLAAASGALIARMDADDVAKPARLAQQLAYLHAHPECVALGSDVEMLDPRGRRLKTLHLPREHDAIFAELLTGNGGAMIHPAVVFRTEVVRRVGGYDERFSGYGEDWDLFYRLGEIGTLHNLETPLLGYRIHAQSYNHSRRADQRAALLGAVNSVRQKRGLDALPELPWAREIGSGTGFREQCICWALEGREFLTAWKLALLHVAAAPQRRRSWAFLSFTARRISQLKKPAAAHVAVHVG